MLERGSRRRGLVAVLFVAVVGILAWWIAREAADDTGPDPLAGRSKDTAAVPEPPHLQTRGVPPALVNAPTRRGEGRVRGVVLDTHGRPVAGVPVVARRSMRYGSHDPFARMWSLTATDKEVARAVSDERGRFVLEGLETTKGDGPASLPPHYEVEAVVAAPRISTRALVANWGPARSHAVLLRVLDGVAVRGRVVDAADRSVPAIVRAHAGSVDVRPLSQSAWGYGPRATDSEGRFTIPAAPRGSLRFDVFVAGRMSVRGLRVQVPEKGELLVRVGDENPGRITGQVSVSDGTPIARAQVLLDVRAQAGAGARHAFLATTDEAGRFLAEGVPPGIVERISARAAGRVARTWRDVGREVRPGATTHFELSLLEGATLRGRVLDDQQAAVVGARVVAYGSGAYRPNETISDAQGRYTLAGLAPGDYQLYVKARGYYDEAGPSVSESSGGLGISWRRVGGPNEAYKLHVEAAGDSLERDFRIQRGLALSGVVLAPDGTPVAFAQVRWKHDKQPRRGQRGGQRRPSRPGSAGNLRGLEEIAVTDEHGRFQHPGLGPPAGVWVVVAHTADACSEPERVSTFDGPVTVTLRLRALGAIRGRVLDASGQPVSWLTVRLDAKGVGTVAFDMSDEAGRFSFDGMTPGSYDVRAMARVQRRWKTVGSSPGLALTPGQEVGDLEVRAVVPESPSDPRPRARRTQEEPQRPIEGTVWAPDGGLVESGRVSVRVEAGRSSSATVLHGRFSVRIDRRATTLSFRVSDPRDREGRTIIHAPFGLSGQPATGGPFTLKLEAGGVIAGRVEDDEGNGIADVKLSIGGDPGWHRGGAGQTTRTDGDGAFRLEGLSEGEHRLRVEVSAEFLGSREVSATTGDTAVRIRYSRGGVIAGQVLGPDGEGMANVELAAMPGDRSSERWVNASSGSDGRFRFVGLTPSATYTVRARPWEQDVGRSDLMHAYAKDVRPGREDIVLRLQVGVFLEGVLLLPDGSPGVGHMVTAFAEGENAGKGPVTTDEKGAFRIGPFAPGASVVVSGSPKAKTEDPATLRGITAPASGLTLRLTSSRVRRGRVAGEKLQGFQWVWTNKSHPYGGRGPVEPDGSFILNRLPGEGTITVYVYARTDDRYALMEGVKTTGDPLLLSLVEGRSVKGTVDESLRKGLGRMIVIRAESVSHGFVKQAYADKDGAFCVRGLPPGRYVLHVLDGQAKEIATTEVEAGADNVVVR